MEDTISKDYSIANDSVKTKIPEEMQTTKRSEGQMSTYFENYALVVLHVESYICDIPQYYKDIREKMMKKWRKAIRGEMQSSE